MQLQCTPEPLLEALSYLLYLTTDRRDKLYLMKWFKFMFKSDPMKMYTSYSRFTCLGSLEPRAYVTSRHVYWNLLGSVSLPARAEEAER